MFQPDSTTTMGARVNPDDAASPIRSIRRLVGLVAVVVAAASGCSKINNAAQNISDKTDSSVYRVTANYDGSVSLLVLWQGAKAFGGRECLDDASVSEVLVVLKDVPEDVSPDFARESRHSCDDLISEIVSG